MRRSLTVLLTAFAMLAVFALPALAYSTITSDPGPFPDTCDIKGYNYYSGLYRSKTIEQDDCARIEAELRYKDNNGDWKFKETGYLYSSSVATAWYSGQNGDYTDHNGDNNGSGTAYGFRINTPGA